MKNIAEDSDRIKKKAKVDIAHLCSKREYCEHEIMQKLIRKGIKNDVAVEILNSLKDEGFVDNRRYAESFIKDKLKFNRWGRRKIEYALREKRVPDEVIAEAFSEFSVEELTRELPPILKEKRRSLKEENPETRDVKLIRFALQRGFLMQDILSCLKEIEEEGFSDEFDF